MLYVFRCSYPYPPTLRFPPRPDPPAGLPHRRIHVTAVFLFIIYYEQSTLLFFFFVCLRYVYRLTEGLISPPRLFRAAFLFYCGSALDRLAPPFCCVVLSFFFFLFFSIRVPGSPDLTCGVFCPRGSPCFPVALCFEFMFQ